MRLIAIIATVLAISIAIPSVLLLTGNLTATQLVAEPINGQNIPEAVVQVPRESLSKEPLPAAESRRSVDVEPKGNALVRPPVQDVILPPQSPEAQPPQQPEAQSQVVQVKQQAAEGVPQGHVLKWAYMEIWRPLGDEGKNVVRANLTDPSLTAYPTFKGALINLNSTTVAWAKKYAGGNAGFEPIIQPTTKFRLTEQDLNEFIQLVNPNLPIKPSRADGGVEKLWDSVITYNGVRYLVQIGALWGS